MDARDLRKRLRAARDAGNRYPGTLREAVVEYARAEHREGRSFMRICEELDMSHQTLAYWRAKASGRLVPVSVVAAHDETTEKDVVVECGPLRVRGLDVAGVAELLRRLA